jgi:hypothetical protein
VLPVSFETFVTDLVVVTGTPGESLDAKILRFLVFPQLHLVSSRGPTLYWGMFTLGFLLLHYITSSNRIIGSFANEFKLSIGRDSGPIAINPFGSKGINEPMEPVYRSAMLRFCGSQEIVGFPKRKGEPVDDAQCLGLRIRGKALRQGKQNLGLMEFIGLANHLVMDLAMLGYLFRCELD